MTLLKQVQNKMNVNRFNYDPSLKALEIVLFEEM